MKITLLSDIHANFDALLAVLRHAHGQGSDQIILNLGDSVGYGPKPDRVVTFIQAERFINILGNYDQKVIDKTQRKAQWSSVKNGDKRAMFAWTWHSLSKPARRYLKSLPESRMVDFGGVRILLSHGSPDSINEHLRPETPNERLAELADAHPVDVILCGHSHQAFIREVNGVLFINPGSVGRLDDGDPRPSYAIMELNTGRLSAQLYRVPYPIHAAVRAMRQTGMPEIFAQVLRQGLSYDGLINHAAQPEPFPPLESNGLITFLTDFGLKDYFVGVMKGVVVGIAPEAKVIDISHQISPQNIDEAAWMLRAALPYFTPGTVHMAVVDPGVGTERRAIAARIGTAYFVAPDNGLLFPLIEDARAKGLPVEIYALDQQKYWLSTPSASFHGRDIFAPIAAHLANGLPIDRLGTLADDPAPLQLSQPTPTDNGWLAKVVLVDVFGNLITNLSVSALPEETQNISITVRDYTIHGLTRTFGDAEPGSLIASIDSSGYLTISMVNGSAAAHLDADLGTLLAVAIS